MERNKENEKGKGHVFAKEGKRRNKNEKGKREERRVRNFEVRGKRVISRDNKTQ